MVTIKEIAAECGVSIATVSNVINGRSNVSVETRKRVLDAVRRTGYQPDYVARGLRKKKTNDFHEGGRAALCGWTCQSRALF